MFEIFTDAAKRALVLGQDEAIALGHDFMGTEHLLLGLVGVSDGLAGQVLGEHGVTAEGARRDAVGLLAAAGITGASSRDHVDALATIGIDADEIRRRADETFGPGQFHFPRPVYSADAKKAIERSVSEARSLGHDYVGTEHLLLGLLEESGGIGVRILSTAGIDPAALRPKVLARMAPLPPTLGEFRYQAQGGSVRETWRSLGRSRRWARAWRWARKASQRQDNRYSCELKQIITTESA